MYHLPHYRSAFSSPRRASNGASSPVLGRNAGSPIRSVIQDDYSLPSVPDLPPRIRRIDYDLASESYGFESPDMMTMMPVSVPDVLMDRRYHRTSPTSVMEFERVRPSTPGCRSQMSVHQAPRSAAAARFGSPEEFAPRGWEAQAEEVNHPTPQNLRDNPERQAKVKTEMCQYYMDGRECPWGQNCNFAHGEHELKFRYSTLLLMESSGQISNAYTYLCRPCLTFVSTGACPFGRRCGCIHDPRVQGPVEFPSWLPMATSKTNAQVIVDPLASHRESATHQENPLVSQSVWQHCRPSLRGSKVDPDAASKFEFEDTYRIVCNTGIPIFLGNHERLRGERHLAAKLNELEKLCIVEHFRQSGDKGFLYSPTHSLRGELCMILQTRYFLLEDVNPDAKVDKSRIVKEISLDEYNARITPWSQCGVPYSPTHVVVGHEVAFAPKGEANCNFSIWFDECPIKLEQTQIKRARRIKQKNKTNIKTGHSRPNANGALIVRSSPVDFRNGCPAIDPFVHMVPAEDNQESNRLIDEIIAHRIDSIIANKWPYFGGASRMAVGASGLDEDVAKALLDRKEELKKSFLVLNSFHKEWTWPRREGLDRISYSTQAPPGNAITYSPSPKKVPSGRKGLHDISNIWQGFVESIPDKGENVQERNKRLPVFDSIGSRRECGPVPRLSQANEENGENDTWQQLLLGKSGEWRTARELYETRMRGSAPARNLPLSTIPFVQN